MTHRPTLNEIVWNGWTITVWHSPTTPGEDAVLRREWVDRMVAGAEHPMRDVYKTIMMRAEKGDERVEAGGPFWKDAENALRDAMTERTL